MTFSLTLSSSDLLLMLPEIILDLVAMPHVDRRFHLPKLPKEQLAYLSIAGLVVMLAVVVRSHRRQRHPVPNVRHGSDGHIFQDVDRGCHNLGDPGFERLRPSLSFFRGEYYFLVLMSALGMMFMASANDLLSVFVTLEFSTFGFYVLVAYLREDVASNEAGLKFFILGVFAAGLLAYGISLVYGETGKLVFSE